MVWAEPEDLTKVRKTYEERQMDLTVSYANWLKHRSEESRGKDYEAYNKELKLIQSKIKSTDTKNIPKNEKADIQGRTVLINARDLTYKIGTLKVGDKVQIQYVSGLWTSFPKTPKDSPDNPRRHVHGVSFVLKDKTITELIIPMRNTKEEPFEHIVEQEGEYFIQMNDPDPGGNDGTVRYKINIINK